MDGIKLNFNMYTADFTFATNSDIICKRLSASIFQWNNFQLKSLHYHHWQSSFGTKPSICYLYCQLFCSQYSFEDIWTVLLHNALLYISFDDDLFKGVWTPFSDMNVVFNIARSCAFPFSFKLNDLKQPSDKHVFISCISNIYPALLFNLW